MGGKQDSVIGKDSRGADPLLGRDTDLSVFLHSAGDTQHLRQFPVADEGNHSEKNRQYRCPKGKCAKCNDQQNDSADQSRHKHLYSSFKPPYLLSL